MKEQKFRISLKELEDAVKFAKEKGTSEHKSITMTIKDAGFMNIIEVSAEWDDDPIDITNFESA